MFTGVVGGGAQLTSQIGFVLERHACEAGVEHPELESALWTAASATAKALEHAARQTDYRTVCEGLARLHRVVASLLDWAAQSGDGVHTDQSVRVRSVGENSVDR